jgi:hypothetical protein
MTHIVPASTKPPHIDSLLAEYHLTGLFRTINND